MYIIHIIDKYMFKNSQIICILLSVIDYSILGIYIMYIVSKLINKCY